MDASVDDAAESRRVRLVERTDSNDAV